MTKLQNDGHRKADRGQPRQCQTPPLPKTVAGRARSSRNAYRHGLSLDLPLEDPAFQARKDAMMQALLGEETMDQNITAAAEVVEAEMKLLQIRKVRPRYAGRSWNSSATTRVIFRGWWRLFATSVWRTPNADGHPKTSRRPERKRDNRSPKRTQFWPVGWVADI